jgi:LAS superfamily LD-carboxypeptidase LdcB
MADLDPELQREMAELTRMLNGLSASTEDLEKGMKAFKKATKDGAKMIPGALGGLAIDIGKGDTSFKSLNKVIDVASDALGGMAKTIPYAGEAINAGIKATAEAAKFMLGQMDASAKAFNELGQVGGLTASGMSGLQKQFTQSGLQLGTFTKLVGDNAMALARFKGTTGEGAETFSAAIGQLTQGKDDSLRRLGLSSDQIGATVGAFVTQQTRLGRSQNMDAIQLAAGAKQYAIELDKLQRVTGYSREELQKQQDASLSESRFRSNVDELYAQGREKEAKALQDMDSRMSKLGPALGQGVRDLTSGSANTDAARRLVASTNGAATGIMARLKSGEITADQANDEMLDALEANSSAMQQTAKFTNGVSDSFVAWNQVSDALNSRRKGAAATADKEQAALLAGTDDLTKKTVEAQKRMEKMSIGLQQLGFKGLPYAASAVDAVTKSMDTLVESINKALGITGKSKDEIKKEREEKSQAAQKTATGMDMGGAETATAGEAQLTPAEQKKSGEATKPGEAAKPGAPPATPGAPAPAPGAQPAAPSDKAVAGKSLSGVNEGLANAIKAAASEYMSVTGKPVQVTSAIRSKEEQQKLYDDYKAGKSKFPAAPPGQSKHALGTAVDIDSGTANAMAQKGILGKYGLGQPVAGDPVHIERISAAEGAMLSGPQQGYQPNLTMHGTEAIVPIDTPAVSGGGAPSGNTSNAEMMTMQLNKLEELAGIFKNQLYVDEKLLKYSS